MASLPKRKRLTKSQRKKLNSEKGKKSADSRGKGLGSRQDFSLPSQWETEVKENPSKDSLMFTSLGKTQYQSGTAVKETLSKRGMCLESSDSTDGMEELSDYIPSPEKRKTSTSTKIKAEEVAIEQGLFVAETSQLISFVDQINATSKCSTENCDGKFLLIDKRNVMYQTFGDRCAVVFSPKIFSQRDCATPQVWEI